MFSFCANFSYINPMPMYMPFGSLCCGGGNSFWGAFLGGFLGSSLSNGGYQQQYYDNNFSYGCGVYNQPIFNINPFSMPASTMFTPSYQMPQLNYNMPSLNFNFSGNYNYMYSPFAAMPEKAAAVTSNSSGVAAYNPFSYTPEKKTTGTRFDSNDYLSGRSTASSVRRSTNTSTSVSYNTKSNLPALAQSGYNATLANKLVNIAMQDKKSSGSKGGDCATYVKNAIQKAGLGKYEYGDAYECADILARNKKHFKEIEVAASDIPKLPAGCVVVYPRGDMNYSDRYGHVEITIGNGQGVSDKVYNVSASSRARVFVPVSA